MVERVLSQPVVAAIRRIADRYGAAGGGLLANGLAYAALFAIVPGMLLAAAIAGLLISDPVQRADAVAVVGGVLPPLRDLVDTILAQASADSGALGVIGLATLAWGASRFVLAFSDAISRVMGRTAHRGFFARNAAAIVAVLLLALAIVGAPALAGAAAFLDTAEATGVLAVVGNTLHLALGAAPPVVTVGAIALVYRAVPVPAAPWRAIWLPAVIVGIVVVVLAQIFVFLAPRLIGAAALLGTIAAVFAALAWLGLSFQALLLGAAWVREREPEPMSGGTTAPEAIGPNVEPEARPEV
jgi:uncharacterized BrkB/YihY/UPF0761 family membrane protein